MFIFGYSGTGFWTYKTHSEMGGLIKIELNIPELAVGAPTFNWWASVFNTDATQAHALLFAKDADNNNIPDENQTVKIYRYYSAQPENPLVVDPDEFANNAFFIREIQKAIAKEYYASVVGCSYGDYS